MLPHASPTVYAPGFTLSTCAAYSCRNTWVPGHPAKQLPSSRRYGTASRRKPSTSMSRSQNVAIFFASSRTAAVW